MAKNKDKVLGDLVNAIDRSTDQSQELLRRQERVEKTTTDLALARKLTDPNDPVGMANLDDYVNKAKIATKRYTNENTNKQDRSNRQLNNIITDQFGTAESDRQENLLKSSGSVSIATHMDTPYLELQRQRDLNTTKRDNFLKNSRSMAGPGKGIYETAPGSKTNTLVGMGKPVEEMLGEQDLYAQTGASLELAMQAKRRAGEDPNSRLISGQKLIDKEHTRLENEGITAGVKAGNYGSYAKESEKLTESGKKLVEAFEKLKEASEKAKDGLDSSTAAQIEADKVHKKAEEEYSHQSKVAKEVKAQSDQGGLSKMQAAMGVATATLDVAKYQFVTSNIAQNNLRAGIAGAVNEEFFDQVSGSKGDAGALRRMSTKYHEYANKQAMDYASISENIAMGQSAAIGIDAAAGAVGAIQVAEGGKTINELAVKTGEALKSVTYAQKGLYGEDAMAARSSIRALDDATNQVGDASMQKFIDFNLGMGRNLVGAGSKGGYDSVNNNLEALSNYGISPDQAANLFGQGSAQIGSSFLKDPGSTLLAAGQAQSMGIMSAENYLGNVGHLTQAGGGSKDMEQVLANAVSRGMDNAKSISAMVSNIASLSSGAAANGVSSVAGNSQLFMSRLEMSRNSGLNDELQQAGAAKDVNDLGKLTSNQNMTVQTMVEQSYFTKHMPNTSLSTRTNLQAVDYAGLLSIKKGLGSKVPGEIQEAQASQKRLGISALDETGIDAAIKGKKEGLVTLYTQLGIKPNRARKLIDGTEQATNEENDQIKLATQAAAAATTNLDKVPNTTDKPTGATGKDKEALEATQASAKTDFKMVKSVDALNVTIGTLSKAMNTLATSLDPNKAQATSVAAAKEMQLDKESLSNFSDGASDLVKGAAELRLTIKPMMGLVEALKSGGKPITGDSPQSQGKQGS